LHVEGLPYQVKSLVLTLTDLSIPFGLGIHWVIWNVPPLKDVEEDCKLGVLGRNGFRRYQYLGPKPPCGMHMYLFQVYALDVVISLDGGKSLKDVRVGFFFFVGFLCF
jgi:Raf kinase inhibitor-like YbhB/YbcL family protein